VRDPHRFIITIGAAQPPRYLLRRPAQLELLLNKRAQRRVQRELRRLRATRTIPSRRFSVLGAVAGSPAIAIHLARDRGVAARDPDSNRPEAVAASQTARDLLTLSLGQTTPGSLPHRWPNTTSRCHTERNVLRPQAELASNRPRREALRPHPTHAPARAPSDASSRPPPSLARQPSKPPGCSGGASIN
jgi:hypothetical protein